MDQAPSYNRKKILIVEDSPTQATVLKQLLAGEDYLTAIAKNGLEGLQKTRALKPDIIISDINMPVMNGFEMCAEIKRDRALRNIPVILLSRLSGTDDIIQGLAAGADNYITKPYETGHLLSKLRQILTCTDRQPCAKDEEGLEITFAGKKHIITANRHTILDVLISTYENAVRQNKKLVEVEFKLKELNDDLEQMVIKRTSDLTKEIAERRQSEVALHESETRYRRLIEAATDYIYTVTVTDGTAVATSHGPGCEGVTGYKSEECDADPDLWYQMVHEEDRDAVLRQSERVLAGELPPPLEHRIIHKNGLIRWVKNTPVPHYEGQVLVAYEGLIADITERKRVEEQLHHSQKMEALGRLAGGMAHDFNNCLTAIIGFSEISMMEMEPGGHFYQNLETIHESALKAAGLTRQLLAFSRKQIVEPSILDINRLITNLCKMLKRLIGEDIELIIDCDQDLGNIKADPTQIEQTLINLSINARDAMPEGGRLTLRASNIELTDEYKCGCDYIVPGEYLLLTVEDNGTGISKEVKEHIFEPFFTTKKEGKGTGLGLATVYGIVSQSGGYISCFSEPGIGTLFNIYFPRVYEKTISDDTVPSRTEHLHGSETILVVEDEETVRASAVTLLKKHGYKVFEACNGHDALSACRGRSGNIDLILTDIIMPLMNGEEFVKRLRETKECPKVIYMSGYTNDYLGHHGVLSETDCFISKPFTSTGLLSKIREVLA